MLFKSNKLFNLKTKKALVKLVIQKLVLLKTFVTYCGILTTVNVCLSVCLSVWLSVCMYACMYVCIYMYVCICMYMYMYDVCTTSVLPFLLGGTTSISKLWKGGHRKVNDCLGGLKEFPCWIVAWGVAMFLVKKKKTFKEKRWLWVPNLKCWSRPSLAKQSINI